MDLKCGLLGYTAEIIQI